MANFFNIPFYTFGGLIFWRDCFLRKGWRIQQNLLFKSFRLLDEHDIRRTRGSYKHCLKSLDNYFSAWEIKETEEEITLILPGIFRTRLAFSKMNKYLRSKGHNTIILSYSSYRQSIKENAKTINTIINNFSQNIKRVNFITYSIGGLVLRELLSLPGDWCNRIKVGRIVQIAPPNQGSQIAYKLSKYFLFRLILGKSLKDMLPDKVKLFPAFSSDIEFGIIAGFKGSEKGYNHLSKCDNDGFISVRETKLSGASDYSFFRLPHFSLLFSQDVLEVTNRYLKHGHFSNKRKIKKIKPAFQDVMNNIY